MIRKLRNALVRLLSNSHSPSTWKQSPLRERSRYILTECCDAPVKLNWWNHNIMALVVPLECVRCGQLITEVGIEDITDGDRRRSDADWEIHMNRFRYRIMYAGLHLPFYGEGLITIRNVS